LETRARGEPEQSEEAIFDEALPPERQRAILEALVKKAGEGDVRIAAFLFDRLYGRPGAAKAATTEGAAGPHFDLSRLADSEFNILVHLLEKCDPRREPAGTGPRRRRGIRTAAIPREPGGVCEGGAEGPVVAKADRRRKRAAPA
jgi:hypothetical protein